MGTWSTKPFGNDTASDWLWELEESKDESVIKAALEAEADGDETIAAAAVVEAARRQPVGKLPPKAKAWVSEHGFVPSNELVEQAIAAVEKIKAGSELRELWEESSSLKQWLKQMDLLLAGLREVQSLPPPVRKPKAPPAPRLLHKMIEKVNPDEESPLRERLRKKLEALTDLDAPIAAELDKTVLDLLAGRGLIPEVQRLVERGAKMNPVRLANPRICNWTPLGEACLNGRSEMVEWLLAHGAQIQVKREPVVLADGSKFEPKIFHIPYALYGAVKSGDIATIEVLVRHGVRIAPDDLEKEFLEKEFGRYQIWHDTLLHKAVEANHPHVIEFLVKNGFNLEAKGVLGLTSLNKAANQHPESTRIKVMEKLLSLGANPNTKDNDGLTPLDLASYHDSNEKVCQLLKSHGGLLGKEIPDGVSSI